MRAAIYGAGAMGTVLGAYIAKAGVQVDLINHNREHVAALKSGGAHIIGTVEFTVPVNAILPEEMFGKYDVIFLMTKQRHNAEVLKFIEPHLSDEGVICTTQNGLPEPSVAAVVGEERTVGCAISWGATFIGEGKSELTTRPDGLEFALGTLYDNARKLDMVKPYLECMGKVTVENNFIGARWSKLTINSAFSALSAITGYTFGGVCDDKYARKVAQALLKECIDTAAACGIVPEKVQGHDLAKLFGYKGAIKKRISYAIIPKAMKKHRALLSSMLMDLRRGRMCEIDLINGVVSEYGKKVGFPTPLNDRAQEIIRRIESGEFPIRAENTSLFKDLV